MREAAETWSENLHEELQFWESTLGSDNEAGRTLRERADRRDLQPWVRQEIRQPGALVRILDVGSGPLTTLGSSWPGHELEIVALDPLADEYNRLLDRLGIAAPVRPVAGRGEHLLEQLGSEQFDFVLSANALDHCADPVAVLVGMVAVAKVGATIVLNHVVNVAEHEHHHGLHQWNLRPEGEDMIVEGYARQELLSDIVPGNDIEIVDRATTFVVKIRKRPRR